jgi:two-component system response regulator YesN
MYSVFLVEDEVVVREGIRVSIPWESTNYALVGEAPDGEMALSILKDVKPDILVTDIKMPFMDGLALSRLVKKAQPWIKIIILSGHDEFQYAREAISIGVEEYLLKPVSAADMLKALDKVAQGIEEEKRKLDSLESLKRQALSTADVLRERWLGSLVTGEVDTADAIEKARGHGIDLISRHYAVMIADFSIDGDDFRELAKANHTALAYAAQVPETIAFSPGGDRVVLIVKGPTPEAIEDATYALAQGLQYETERNSKCSIAVGIGSAVERVGGIPRSYAEAVRSIKFLASTGRRGIMGINDIHAISEADLMRLGNDPVADKLRYTSRGDVECLVEQYAAMIGDNPAKSGFIGYYLLYDIIVAASAIIRELGGDLRAVFPEPLQQDKLAEIAGSQELFVAETRRIVSAVVECREASGEGRYGGMVLKAKRYIDENFAKPGISLHSVASFVNVSPNHFSTVFSQESGESFIEYLTCVRIDRAKRLLVSTQMKSADIAYEVGFNDPHYFSFIFKKNTGMTPRDFRAEKNAPAG